MKAICLNIDLCLPSSSASDPQAIAEAELAAVRALEGAKPTAGASVGASAGKKERGVGAGARKDLVEAAAQCLEVAGTAKLPWLAARLLSHAGLHERSGRVSFAMGDFKAAAKAFGKANLYLEQVG